MVRKHNGEEITNAFKVLADVLAEEGSSMNAYGHTRVQWMLDDFHWILFERDRERKSNPPDMTEEIIACAGADSGDVMVRMLLLSPRKKGFGKTTLKRMECFCQEMAFALPRDASYD